MKEFFIRSFFLVVLFSLSTARDAITPTQPLGGNETLISAGGSFVLGFFTPPNSGNRYIGIWYNNIAVQTILWVANRANPVVSSTGVLSVTSNGTMMITDGKSTVVWSADSTSSGMTLTDPVAQLLDEGNFVVKQDGNNNNNNYAWQGFDYPTDTLLSGMKLGVDRTTALNRTLTAWKSNDDPSPGKYYLAMDTTTSSMPEIVLFAGSVKLWRSGPWDGAQFSGFPTMNGFTYSFVNNNEEVISFYKYSGQSNPYRLKVSQSGTIQMLNWSQNTTEWNLFWQAPSGHCDNIGECGPNSICDATVAPICQCLFGFMPKNQKSWSLGNYADGGCVRKTALNCSNNSRESTDGFHTVNGVKLPLSSISPAETTSVLSDCLHMCLQNCSCIAYALSADGEGCVVWANKLEDVVRAVDVGQDLYLRLAAADLDSQKPEKKKVKKVAIVVSLLSVAFLLLAVGCFLWKRNKRRRVNVGANKFLSEKSKKGDREKDLDLPSFDFCTIAAATDQFSDGNRLGQGGFGPVYKGKLGEDQEIAVKRLAKTSLQGTEEFKNEAMLIAKLQNRNLVQLLGCCVEGEERMLIYEYMPNKSLDAFLFVKEKSALLDWQTRYQIIIGITRGLFYLHHDSRFRIIHRDLKASNILLDEEMNPKISDFGMARLFGGNVTDYNTRKVVGTYGYMSPEYAMHGIFSLKSDVFSFGVLLLEIISGKRNSGSYAFSSHPNLVAHAWHLWNDRKSLKLAEESMSEIFPKDEVLKCIQIGLLCVQEHPEDRPLMSAVILMFGADITSLQQPKQPGFIARMSSLDLDQIPNFQDLCTSNELTVTIVGR